MAEYISRESAAKALMTHRGLTPIARLEAATTVCHVPAADVKPVVRGKWIPIRLGDCKCSVCNSVYGICGGLLGDYYFCPNCGADMREVQG